MKFTTITEELDWRTRVFDSISFPSLILKPNRVIISANKAFLEDKGVSLEEVVGKTCHLVFYSTEEPCSPAICPFSKVITEKKGHSILRRIGDDQGAEVWVDRMFSPILDDDGQVKFIMESVRDVTRVMTLEKMSIGIRQFLDKVIQSSPNAIIAADRHGNILLMNQAAEDLFGYSMEEAVRTKNVETFYPPEKARAVMKKLRSEKFGGKGKLSTTRTKIINSTGDKIPVEMTAAIIYEGSEEVASMALYNDLRDKLNAERKLKEAQVRSVQAEKMASLGQLAAGVAHEINNPLTGILLYGNITLERLDESNPLREYMENVLEDAGRCKDIVKHLLAYSRQTSPSREIFHINTLVDQSLNLIRDQKRFQNVEIIKDLADEMMMIHGDKNQLSQVIINLVMNAVDAMEMQGNLTIRTYRNKEAKKVFFEISDTGGGIDKGNLSKIFDPFFTTKGLDKGTGLGLSTSYGIVKENGGHISIKNTGPEGTTFLVELPLYEPVG